MDQMKPQGGSAERSCQDTAGRTGPGTGQLVQKSTTPTRQQVKRPREQEVLATNSHVDFLGLSEQEFSLLGSFLLTRSVTNSEKPSSLGLELGETAVSVLTGHSFVPAGSLRTDTEPRFPRQEETSGHNTSSCRKPSHITQQSLQEPAKGPRRRYARLRDPPLLLLLCFCLERRRKL